MGLLVERAPAKVNLSLHILARRADGYHDLESLVAFSASGDLLTFEPGEKTGLTVGGPFAEEAGDGDGNSVTKAVRELNSLVPDMRMGRFCLHKTLPVAAGIGGGSSDAAAALRLLARHNGVTLSDSRLMEAAAKIGSDVPVCLRARACLMRGRGETLSRPVALPPLFAVLVNPGAALKTPDVFDQLGLERGDNYSENSGLSGHPSALQGATDGNTEQNSDPEEQMPFTELIAMLRKTRNDLEGPASVLCPVISDVLAIVGAARGCQLARMSGSGATCFGLFETRLRTVRAARAIKQSRPDWWVRPCILR